MGYNLFIEAGLMLLLTAPAPSTPNLSERFDAMPKTIQQPSLFPPTGRKSRHRIQQHCVRCENSYWVWPSASDQKYCSKRCSQPRKSFMRACKWCGHQFKVKPYTAHHAWYCSRECRARLNPDGTKTCKKCEQPKPLDTFEKLPVSPNAVRGVCKDCHRPDPEVARRYYAKRVASYAQWRDAKNKRRAVLRKNRTAEQRQQELLRDRAYAASHAEKIRAYQQAYRAKNAARLKAHDREYRKAHRVEVRHRNIKRRIKQRGNEGSYLLQEWRDLCALYGNACACCREVRKLTVDHVIPVADGGSNFITNIQPLCLKCNIQKGRRSTDYRYLK